jgi:hypothetical protein
MYILQRERVRSAHRGVEQIGGQQGASRNGFVGTVLRNVPVKPSSSPSHVPNAKAQLMVVIEGKQKEAAATEEVVSKAPISPPKKGGLNGHDSNHQTWGSHV